MITDLTAANAFTAKSIKQIAMINFTNSIIELAIMLITSAKMHRIKIIIAKVTKEVRFFMEITSLKK